MAVHKGRTAVYRFFDRGDALIYVGIAANPRRRWADHVSQSPWWDQVVTREVEWFDTRDGAEAAEALTIAHDRPRWNVAPGVLGAEVARPPRRSTWIPPVRFTSRRAEYQLAEEALTAARTRLEEVILDEMRAGVSATKIAPHTPWTYESLRTLAREHRVPRLRQPRVRSLRTPLERAS
ncbi:GIY-YIG nuclease family protein [Embleya sp. NPDC059237]|uniref:GIY-YIG nuclease family protein n=1 Tax=Embleya sp. NPDC059237 TaxID=3346784 RepID=UPI0036B23557